LNDGANFAHTPAGGITRAGQLPAFEVASIKANNTGDGRSTESTSPGRVTAVNTNISSLIQQAFGIKEFQISGAPGGSSTTNTISPQPRVQQRICRTLKLEPYFQALLTERFHLQYHREAKEMQVYALGVAKNRR